MVEPSDSLQRIFDQSIEIAKKYNHEYLTLEHLLFAIVMLHPNSIFTPNVHFCFFPFVEKDWLQTQTVRKRNADQ